MVASKTLLFMALAGVASASYAAEAEDSPPAPDVFVGNATQDGMTEVELGRIALDKSKNAEVRAFAQRMVTDHSKANQELAALAKAKGIATTMTLDTEHAAMVRNLKAKNGAEFDSAYSHHMNMDHTKAIALFQAESNSSDAALAGFAKKALPMLEEHKELASKLPGQ